MLNHEMALALPGQCTLLRPSRGKASISSEDSCEIASLRWLGGSWRSVSLREFTILAIKSAERGTCRRHDAQPLGGFDAARRVHIAAPVSPGSAGSPPTTRVRSRLVRALRVSRQSRSLGA